VRKFTTHDTGCLFGCYGVREVQTPNIDNLASDGVRFSRFFAPNPVCSPSRATLTTGRYPTSHGVVGGCHAPDFNGLRPDERHISRILSENGYHCESFGLAHESLVGDKMGFHRRNLEIRPTLERYSCEIIAPAVIDFLDRHKTDPNPFYVQVGFFETHQPFDFGGVKPDQTNGIHMPGYLLRCPENEQKMALLQGSIKKVDQAIGSILDALKQYALDENTLVIFTVDHGIEMPRAKFTLYEPGLHVPLILRWPAGGVCGGRVYPHLTGNVDVLPSLLELLGLASEPKMEGVSFAKGLKSLSCPPHRGYVYAAQFGADARSIRNDRYKLIRNFAARRPFSPPVDPKTPFIQNACCPRVELYDLLYDPNEFDNVADRPEYKEIRKQLDGALWDLMYQLNDPIFKGATPQRMWYECMAECPIPLPKGR